MVVKVRVWRIDRMFASKVASFNKSMRPGNTIENFYKNRYQHSLHCLVSKECMKARF